MNKTPAPHRHHQPLHYHAAVKHEPQLVEQHVDVVETTDVDVMIDGQVEHYRVIRSLRVFAHKVDVTRVICVSLLGKEHTHRHRMITGTIVMGVGVFIAHLAAAFSNPIITGLLDMSGYAIHGLGLTPFAVYLSEKFEQAGK